MAKGLRIRGMTEADLETCAAVYIRAYEAPPYNGCWDNREALAILTELRRLYPDDCFVAERSGEIIGFIVCGRLLDIKAEVEEFAVAPEHQRQGVGTALLAHVQRHFRKQGVRFLELIANRGAPAYDFYCRRGFAESLEYRLMTMRL